MVTLPVEPAWSLRSLSSAEASSAIAFLEREPLINVYFLSRLLDEGVGPGGQTVEILRGGEVVALASLSSNLVLAASPDLDDADRDRAMEHLAERVLGRMIPVRAIIADARLVDPLWRRLAPRLAPPTVIRLNQPVYAIPAGPTALPDLETLRYAAESDLHALVPACAAMHVEEVGIDPLRRDAAGYRQRVRELILKRRSLVLTERGRVVFKCEFSAVTPAAVQIMGVWTRPSHRRRGLARTGMSQVCGHVLRQRKAITLFVNDFNTAAVELYESLGFRQIGTNRALIW
ncbi:MAG TPA: GNAT family N-acetyltransferase [Thermoanaerobaculia bacterium]|nr:GNAT family N-acetyltransferase [Thermoanaerobaculia bacterium]